VKKSKFACNEMRHISASLVPEPLQKIRRHELLLLTYSSITIYSKVPLIAEKKVSLLDIYNAAPGYKLSLVNPSECN